MQKPFMNNLNNFRIRSKSKIDDVAGKFKIFSQENRIKSLTRIRDNDSAHSRRSVEEVEQSFFSVSSEYKNTT
jgi:hypothetical protein